MNIEEFKTKKEELKRAMEKDGQKLITELFQKAFDEIPSLQSIEWTQYTPYFNDGDACVFGVNELYFGFNKQDAESKVATMADLVEDDNDDEDYESDDPFDAENKFTSSNFNQYGLETMEKYYPKHFEFFQNLKLNKKQIELIEEISNTSNSLEDLFEIAFGDHVSVTAVKNKKEKIEFIVKEYNHD